MVCSHWFITYVCLSKGGLNIECGLCCAENEGALKIVEGTRVEKTLYEICVEIMYKQCQDNDKCFTVCRKKYGNLASGVCNYKEECVCRHPC